MIKSNVVPKLNEIAIINNPNDVNLPFNKFSVVVNSDDHTPPHFHFRCIELNIELKIDIVNLTIIHSTPRKGISKNDLLTWKGLTDEYRKLKKWMSSMNFIDKTKTNFEFIITVWNLYHITKPNAEVDSDIKNPWN